MIQQGVIKHPMEKERLDALYELNVIETPIEERFERITRLVARMLDMPMCAVSCIELHRQWFKSIQGIDVEQTERCISFCQHTILKDEIMVIHDSRIDKRFETNPLVINEPRIVFYAGAPVFSKDGLPVATLCVFDRKPRSFSDQDRQTLYDFARVAESLLHTPRENIVEECLINQIGESWRSTMIDPKTRLWNAEGINLLIEESIKHAEHRAQQVCIARFDINGINQVRAELGQDAGDALLTQFTKAALQCMDHADSIGHLCNNEFTMILTQVENAEDAIDRLARLQIAVDSIKVKGVASGTRLATQTAGVIVSPDQTRSITSVLEQVENTIQYAYAMNCPSPRIVNYVDDSSLFGRIA